MAERGFMKDLRYHRHSFPGLFFFSLLFVSITLMLGAYFFLPTRSAEELLAPFLSPKKVYAQALWLGALGTVFFALLHQFFTPSALKDSSVSSPPRLFVYLPQVQIFFSVVIFLNILFYFFKGPLDFDENNTAVLIATKSLGEILKVFVWEGNVLTTSAMHPISILSEYMSVKLLGAGELAIRLPSVIYGVSFLITLFFFIQNWMPSVAAVPIYLNLCVNGLVAWYLQSSRSYSPLFLFSLLTLFFTLKVTHGRQTLSPRQHYLFITVYTLTILTNANGAIFCLLIFFGLLLWASREALSSEQKTYFQRLFLILFCFTPLIAAICLRETLNQKIASSFQGAAPELGTLYVGYLLGLTRVWQAKLILVGTVFVIILRKRTKQNDFLEIFLGISAVFFLAVIVLMNVSYLEPRYFLAFLIPWLVWLSKNVHSLGKGSVRTAATALLVLAVGVFPILHRKDLVFEIFLNTRNFAGFVETVREKLMLSSACLEIVGNNREALWAKHIYFTHEKKSDCHQNIFVTFFEDNKKDFSRLGEKIVEDEHGRKIFLSKSH